MMVEEGGEGEGRLYASKVRSCGRAPPDATSKPPHHGQFHLPLDWKMIDKRMQYEAPPSVEKCRIVMSIFRQGDKPDGGWRSFVWYAKKLEDNVIYLNNLMKGWRTRLYLDTSVPPNFIRYLKDELNVEIVLVEHQRHGRYRDYLIASCRLLILDDASVDRFVCLDCHDELTDEPVQRLLTGTYANKRSKPQLNWTFWDVETTNNNAAGAYCHVNGVMYNKRKSDSQLDTTHPQGDCTHRHIDAGCWGLLGKRSLWFGKAPEDHVLKMMKRVIQRHRVIPGHEEAFLDVLIGNLFRAPKIYITSSKAHTGCRRKDDIKPKDVDEWKSRFMGSKDKFELGGFRDLERDRDVLMVNLNDVGKGERVCPLTSAYMDRCWTLNLPENIAQRSQDFRMLNLKKEVPGLRSVDVRRTLVGGGAGGGASKKRALGGKGLQKEGTGKARLERPSTKEKEKGEEKTLMDPSNKKQRVSKVVDSKKMATLGPLHRGDRRCVGGVEEGVKVDSEVVSLVKGDSKVVSLATILSPKPSSRATRSKGGGT